MSLGLFGKRKSEPRQHEDYDVLKDIVRRDSDKSQKLIKTAEKHEQSEKHERHKEHHQKHHEHHEKHHEKHEEKKDHHEKHEEKKDHHENHAKHESDKHEHEKHEHIGHHHSKHVSTSHPFRAEKSEMKNLPIERRIYKMQKRMETRLNHMGSEMTYVISELRKENEEIRRDRQFLLEKMKNILLEIHKESSEEKKMHDTEYQEHHPAPQEGEEQETQQVEEEQPEEQGNALEDIIPSNSHGQSGKKPPMKVIKAVKGKLHEKPEKHGFFHHEKHEEKKQDKKQPEQQPRPGMVNENAQASGSRSIETPLDELLEFIMTKGAVKVSDAAKHFKVKENQIEEWAHILEQHELIELHYPTIGRPVMKRKSGS